MDRLKSSISKYELALANSVGVIDSGYRNTIKLRFRFLGKKLSKNSLIYQKGDKIGIIEAMKLFNEIEAEISGKIVKILVDDSSPVEYDQPLFLVEPA